MSRPFFILAFCFAILCNRYGQSNSAIAVPPIQDSQTLSIKNASFVDWKNGQPAGWNVEIGANNGGDAPVSKFRKGDGPSIELSGDLKTIAWNMVRQTIEVQPQRSIRFSYVAKAVGIKREGNQFDNCYVGVFFKSSGNAKLPPKIWTVLPEELTNESRIFRVPDKVKQIDVIIFLSKTGTLNVTDLKLESLDPADSFDILVEDMARNYSFFEHKQIDWKNLTDRYRERATTAATSAEFAKVAKEMLAELKDVHIWIVHKDQKHYPFNSNFSANYNFPWLSKQLVDQKRIGKLGVVGRTKDGFGYARINSLNGIGNRELSQMVQQIAQLFNAPGFILDLRRNNGGAEGVAGAMAGMFTDKQLVYGRQAFRSGAGFHEFAETAPRVLWPTKGKKFSGPVVCLIGPGAISSAEGFAMMMKANPNCTLVGLPTRGASGNPAPAELPNGVDVWYSRWKSLLPDGTLIEDVGVKPDINVEHVPGTDAAFQKAVEVLADTVKGDQSP